MNVANRFTTARIIMTPFFISAYLLKFYSVAFVIFLIASLTDYIDGRIARKRNLTSNYGKIMDPVADKILVYSAFCLLTPDYVKGWMLIIILAREFLISGMRIVAASNGNVIAAGISGKIKTALQMVAVSSYLLFTGVHRHVELLYSMSRMRAFDKIIIGFDYFLQYFAPIMLYLSLIMTVYSGIEYAFKNRHVFKD